MDLKLPRLGGRVAKRSGFRNKRDLSALRDAIRGLYARGDDEVIRFWIRDEINAPDLIRAYRTGFVVSDFNIRDKDLAVELSSWGQSGQYGDENRRINGYLLKRLGTFIGGRKVREVPEILEGIRRDPRVTKVDFNQFRKLSLSYVRNNAPDKNKSPLYLAIRAVPAFQAKEYRRANNHRPFQVNNLDFLLEKEAIPELAREWIWWWVLHGLRPIELYEQGWTVHTEGLLSFLEVHGQKTESAHRRIPLLQQPPSEVPVPRTSMRTYLRKLGRQLYDCRRSYMILLDNAKVPRNVAARWMGHSAVQTMGELYLKQDDLAWIRQFAPRVQEYLEYELDHAETGLDAAVLVPYASRSEIGKSRQALTLQEVKTRLNLLLKQWYEGDNQWMRKLYRVDHLVDVADERAREERRKLREGRMKE